MLTEPLAVKINEAKLVELVNAGYSTSLSEAELSIIHDSVRPWSPSSHAQDRPETRKVRGDFLRWLLHDSRTAQYLDQDGLQIVAATVEGDVNLNHSHIQCDAMFLRCVFTGGFNLIWAETRSIKLINSTLKQMQAAPPFRLNLQNAMVSGDIDLDGLECHGAITMYGTRISGDLSMKGTQLLGPNAQLYVNDAEIRGAASLETLHSDGPVNILDTTVEDHLIARSAIFYSAFNLTGTNIKGNLSLEYIHSLHDPSSTGGVELAHVKVGGSVYLNGANLESKPLSLSLANATVAGGVFLNDSTIAGVVSLWQAAILQTLDVSRATMAELDCSESHLGKLVWEEIGNPHRTVLLLLHANVKEFRDDYLSWPLRGNLFVVGFTYEQISLAVKNFPSRDGEGDPDQRIAWLRLQRADELGVAQPWMQLSQYVLAQGNPSGSKKVLYTMKRIQARKAGLLIYSRSFVYDFIDQEPLRVLFFIGVLWVFGSVIVWRARRMELKAMSPKDRTAFEHFRDHGAPPPQHVPFNPLIYVLENILPVVKFGQDDAWGPNPQVETPQGLFWRRWPPRLSYNWLAGVRWLLIALGWVLAIILAGAIGSRFSP
jgi:hypothetical protein